MVAFLKDGKTEQSTPVNPEELYRENWVNLVFFATKFVRNRDNAVEIVAEIFKSIITTGKTFQSHDHGKSYLYIKTRNRCYNFLKKEKRISSSRREIANIIPQWQEADTLLLHTSETLEQLSQDAFETLSKRDKFFIELCAFTKLSMKQIAEITGHANANAAYYKKHRIRQYLKKYIRQRI